MSSEHKAHCAKCKQTQPITNLLEMRASNGRLMMKCECTVCSTKTSTFIKDPNKKTKSLENIEVSKVKKVSKQDKVL